MRALLPLLLVLQDAPTPPPEAAGPEAIHLPADPVELPLGDVGGRPAVEIACGDARARVLLDTGSTLALTLTPEACRRLGLETLPPAADAPQVPRRRADELRLGGVRLVGVPVAELGFVSGLGVDGVLGFPCLAQGLWTIDFAGRRLRVEAGRLEPGPDTVPFRRDLELGFGVVVDVDAAGVRVPVHLDTGSPELALFSGLVQPELRLAEPPRLVGRARTPMGDADIASARLDGALALGPLRVASPVVRFGDLPQIAGRRLGNVGAALFREASLTIDASAGLLRIQALPAEGALQAGAPR